MIGKYIVLEGVNGSGKTSIINTTLKEAKKRGLRPIYLKAPSKKNEAACRDTRSQDKLTLARVNAMDKAEISIMAWVLASQGYNVFQDRGSVSALVYNGIDGIGFEKTTDLLAEEMQKILKNPKHFNALLIEAGEIPSAQGYDLINPQPVLKSEELRDELLVSLGAHGFIMPDLVVSPMPNTQVTKETFKRRIEAGEMPDAYEENPEKEMDMFFKAINHYSKIGGKFRIINSLYGKRPEEYLPYPSDPDKVFNEACQFMAGAILDGMEKTEHVTNLRETLNL